MRNYLPALVSVVLLIVFVILFICSAEIPAWAASEVFLYAVLSVFGLVFVLGAVFSQNRMSLVSVVYAATLLILQYEFFIRADVARGNAAVLLASIHLPLLTVIFYHLRECELISRQGLVIAAVAVCSSIGILIVPEMRSFREAASASGVRLLEPASTQFQIPLIGVLVFAASLPPMLVRKKHDGPTVGFMFCIALLFVFLALNFRSSMFDPGQQFGILRGFMFGSGIVLMIAVLNTSWRHANIDELTELPGRRQMYRHFERLGSRYVIAVVDIDHFKKINDRYGHAAGDQVLRYVAAELRDARMGRAYRVGGEEFIIILEGVERDIAVTALDELRKKILARPFGVRSKMRRRKRPAGQPAMPKTEGDTVSISVSIGVAEANERHRVSAQVVAAADKALYAAKKAGRNRVKISR